MQLCTPFDIAQAGACVRRATTHTDLQLRARALGIPVHIIHNASIMTAVGACGLQLYRFGEASTPIFHLEDVHASLAAGREPAACACPLLLRCCLLPGSAEDFVIASTWERGLDADLW
jgi:hypothetical protein